MLWFWTVTILKFLGLFAYDSEDIFCYLCNRSEEEQASHYCKPKRYALDLSNCKKNLSATPTSQHFIIQASSHNFNEDTSEGEELMIRNPTFQFQPDLSESSQSYAKAKMELSKYPASRSGSAGDFIKSDVKQLSRVRDERCHNNNPIQFFDKIDDAEFHSAKIN